jgi:hypothetical protein
MRRYVAADVRRLRWAVFYFLDNTLYQTVSFRRQELMKGKSIRELLGTGATKAGSIILATALVMGISIWAGNQGVSVPELTKIVDDVGDGEFIDIEPDQTPEGNTKVTTTTKTTKSTKKVKLKAKSKKTYSKKSAAKKKTKTTKQSSTDATTTTKTVTTTQMTSNFKKGSNINTQVTTTKVTTTKTVVMAAAGNTTAQASATQSTAATATQPTEKTTVALASAAPKLTSSVANAYLSLNFQIVVDPSVSYSGLFDARSQTITLKTLDDTVYHEIGHFLAFIAGNIDTSASFQAVFAQEKASYTAFNKAYVLQSSSEYFAESYKNYILDGASLKESRPQTYAAIETALAAVTPTQIAKIKAMYGSIWTL